MNQLSAHYKKLLRHIRVYISYELRFKFLTICIRELRLSIGVEPVLTI